MLQPLGDLTLSSLVLFFFTLLLFASAVWIGKRFLGRIAGEKTEGDEDSRMIVGAILSLLGLLIGFTMSMSISGFNDRQTSEQNEAITIYSAYLRADLLPEQPRLKLKTALVEYLHDRIEMYETQDPNLRLQLRKKALDDQNGLWQIVTEHGINQQTPIVASVVASVNDLVSAQQKTIADWRHQIPFAAWILLVVIAIFCNLLIGYNARRVRGKFTIMLILPAMISLAFLMIAEIDAPGRGVIRVAPVNLQSLVEIMQIPTTTQSIP